MSNAKYDQLGVGGGAQGGILITDSTLRLHPNIVLFLNVLDLTRFRIALGAKGEDLLKEVIDDRIWRLVIDSPKYHAGARTVLPCLRFSRYYDHLFKDSHSNQLRIRVEVLEHTLLGYSFVYEEDEDISARAIRRWDAACVRSRTFPSLDGNGCVIVELGSSFTQTPFPASYSAFAIRARVYDVRTKAMKQQALSFCVAAFGGSNAIVFDANGGAGGEASATDGENDDACVHERLQKWFKEQLNQPMLFVMKRIAPSKYAVDRVYARIQLDG